MKVQDKQTNPIKGIEKIKDADATYRVIVNTLSHSFHVVSRHIAISFILTN